MAPYVIAADYGDALMMKVTFPEKAKMAGAVAMFFYAAQRCKTYAFAR